MIIQSVRKATRQELIERIQELECENRNYIKKMKEIEGRNIVLQKQLDKLMNNFFNRYEEE